MKSVSKPIMIATAAVIVLCCGGGAIFAVLGDDKKKETAQAAATAPATPPLATASAPSHTKPSLSPSPSPVPVKMLDVTGQNAAVAFDALKKAGFTNVTLGSADPKDKVVVMAANWKVIEQSTLSGETVQSDTLIVLTCTKKR